MEGSVSLELVQKCSICGKSFSTLKALKSHVKSHGNEDYRTCQLCEKTFRDSYALKRHISSSSHENTTTKILSACGMCECELTRSDLSKHYKDHGLDIQEENLTFQTYEEFEKWKNNTENQTMSKYVKQRGDYVNKDGTQVISFFCHRDGLYSAKGHNIRSLKSQGSNKVGFCPSKIVLYKGEVMSVKYVKTHVGHSTDLGHLSLTKEEKDEIASKLALKIPFEEILNDIRSSVYDQQLNRVHLTTRKDLHNVIESYQLNKESVYDSSDYISVDSWVKHMQSTSNVIRFYKPQGEVVHSCPQLKCEDFCLILANDAQLSMLETYGNDVVCLDGTHGLNGYDFELFTLLVLNDLREGFPCSFMFCNRSDSVVMEMFFKIIEYSTNEISPKYFMSDMAESFFNGWCAVHPNSNVQKLFCSWHVDKAWRQNLTKITGMEDKIHTYKQIKVLMMERDQHTFSLMAQNLLKNLYSQSSTKEFAVYFEKFVNEPEPWAYCYRLNSGVNTNMHLESMHRIIKHIYLKGQKVKRLDKAIHALMNFVRDKLFDQLITVHKGKVTNKVSEIRIRHRKSQEMDSSLVQKISDTNWAILSSSSKETYTVCINKVDCDCKLRCNECSVCIHYYTCTCTDASVKWNMCKHMHLVSRMENLALLEKEVSGASMSNETVLLREVSNDSKRSNADLENQKRDILEKVKQLLEISDTQEKLDVLAKQLAPVKSIITSLELKRKSFCAPQNSKLQEPATKKICPQRRFVSTKRKAVRKKPNISKPTEEETEEITQQMILRN